MSAHPVKGKGTWQWFLPTAATCVSLLPLPGEAEGPQYVSPGKAEGPQYVSPAWRTTPNHVLPSVFAKVVFYLTVFFQNLDLWLAIWFLGCDYYYYRKSNLVHWNLEVFQLPAPLHIQKVDV